MNAGLCRSVFFRNSLKDGKIEDTHPLPVKIDNPISSQIRQGAIHINNRQPQGIGEMLLLQRKRERSAGAKIVAAGTAHQFQYKLRQTSSCRPAADIGGSAVHIFHVDRGRLVQPGSLFGRLAEDSL